MIHDAPSNVGIPPYAKILDSKLDSYEQRNRNINLVLHGVPEADKENVKEVCANGISNNVIPLSTDDIAR